SSNCIVACEPLTWPAEVLSATDRSYAVPPLAGKYDGVCEVKAPPSRRSNGISIRCGAASGTPLSNLTPSGLGLMVTPDRLKNDPLKAPTETPSDWNEFLLNPSMNSVKASGT